MRRVSKTAPVVRATDQARGSSSYSAEQEGGATAPHAHGSSGRPPQLDRGLNAGVGGSSARAQSRPSWPIGSGRDDQLTPELRCLAFLRSKRVGKRHLKAKLSERSDQSEELLALVLRVRRGVVSEFGDAHGVVLGVPGASSTERLELLGR